MRSDFSIALSLFMIVCIKSLRIIYHLLQTCIFKHLSMVSSKYTYSINNHIDFCFDKLYIEDEGHLRVVIKLIPCSVFWDNSVTCSGPYVIQILDSDQQNAKLFPMKSLQTLAVFLIPHINNIMQSSLFCYIYIVCIICGKSIHILKGQPSFISDRMFFFTFHGIKRYIHDRQKSWKYCHKLILDARKQLFTLTEIL